MKRGFTPLEIQKSQSLFKGSKTKPPNGLISFSTKSGSKFLTGFTLVEILVTMTLFVTVIAISSTIFVSAIRGQRRNLAYQELLDQTSYVMEYMSRAIRMAIKDDVAILGFPAPVAPGCIPDSPAPYEPNLNYWFDGSCLIFRNYKDECQQFCLVSVDGRNRLVEIIDGGPQVDLTAAPSLNVLPLPPNLAWVALTGEGQGDNFQPRVAILLQVEGREGVRIQIQTSVSQRNLDVMR